MSYFTRDSVETEIPPAFVVEALDDDNDLHEDPGLWDQVETEANEAVDGYLSRRYATPLPAPVPKLAKEAGKIFACEILYRRRGMYGAKNPFHARAEAMRDLLEKVAAGEVGLGPGTGPARPPISIVTEPAGTVPRRRLNG